MKAHTTHQVRKLIRLSKDRSPNASRLVHATAVSCGVISYFIGQPWVDRHIIRCGEDGFLYPGFVSQPDRTASMRKIWELADMLRHLQHVQGFEEALGRLKTDDVEAGFAVLEIGRALRRSGVPFRFVKPKGIDGNDYDYEAYPNAMDTVCIEGRCTLHSALGSDETMQRALNQARQQLPKDKPGVIFARIPESWLLHDLNTRFVAVTKRFLAQTRRVAAVIGCSRVSSIPFDGTKMISPFVAREFFSERPEFARAKGWKLVKKPLFDSDWPTIYEMVGRQ